MYVTNTAGNNVILRDIVVLLTTSYYLLINLIISSKDPYHRRDSGNNFQANIVNFATGRNMQCCGINYHGVN